MMKWIKILTIVISCLLLVACSKASQGEQDAKEDADILVEAIFNKDAKTIKDLFSDQKKNEIENIDAKIEELINFCDGKYVSHSSEVVETESSTSNNGFTAFVDVTMTIEIKTDADEYELDFDVTTEDTKHKKKEGFNWIDIVRQEDAESPRWINRNVIYDEKKVEWKSNPDIKDDIVCYYSEDLRGESDAKKDADILVKAIFKKDVEKIKNLFSDRSIKDIQHVDDKVEKLIAFCDGVYVSHSNQVKEAKSHFTNDEWFYVFTEARVCITIKTDKGEYVLCFDEMIENNKHRDKEGINWIDIVRKEDEKSSGWINRNKTYDEKKKEWKANPDIINSMIYNKEKEKWKENSNLKKDIICYYSEDLSAIW